MSTYDEQGIDRRLSLAFLLAALLFFPMIFNPIIFGFFDAESDAARLKHVREHLTMLRLLFSVIGITELTVGFSLWIWGRRQVHLPGRSGNVARGLSWVALTAGIAAIISRWAVWLQDSEQIAAGDGASLAMLTFIVAAVGFSLAFIVFGLLMIRGPMPTWLGAVWVFCGVIFWVGILPLWFFVASLVFGVRGVLKTRAAT